MKKPKGKNIEVKAFERELYEETNGYNICQHCSRSNMFAYSTHHLIKKSQKKNHPELHNKDNLIFLCNECHEEAERSAEWNYKYIKERNLIELFGSDILK